MVCGVAVRQGLDKCLTFMFKDTKWKSLDGQT